MHKLKYIIIILVGGLLAACQKEDFLDRYPLDAVTEPVFFKTPNDLKIYMNQYYNRSNFPVMEKGKGDVGTDIYITESAINPRLEGSRSINSAPGLNYTNIRSVNYFFANYKKCEADFKEYQQYVGEAFFFRAMFYFNLLKSFGDVQLVETVLTTSSPELYGTRSPRNVVADKIISDLDSAALYLSTGKSNGHDRINKWIALLYQSRVALYEGTWEKYHAGTKFGVAAADPAKYFNKAVEAATTVMNSGLYDIYSTGKPNQDYNDLFGLRDYSPNKEVMFWTKMNLSLGIHAHSKLYRLETPEGFGLTKQLADSYLSLDGKPVSKSPLFKGHDNIILETENRDPRFVQTIFTPGSPWYIEANGAVRNWQEAYAKLYSNSTYSSSTGYVRRKDYNPTVAYHHLNFEESPTIQYRYAEVLLNYIEAKAELGQITQDDIDKTIKKLRDRVGMPNLELANIETDPNWEFPALAPIINEIRRERKIELALEEFRWDDIARWAAADELIVGKRPKGAKVSQFTNKPALPTDENGFLDPFKNALPTGYGFKLDRDYLNPLPQHELTLNNKLVQNPGW
ncbi:RagB/SusD family nutrient uptake outer membrane protein [Adhaeribacter rhizoryzae]|uniref:RagB/SusD family nutrient uptake outer membrane protein n=1 Tax=Adhaeribacter rhizoryzae TaxID=2607907 RepID=A0A5M6DSG5_9BACT|nr:RagB/SusD family nutrient uptake outer membrane protein [Adhaeribacter rhizoryzae]KAA5549172.1 RagB/SusD family nutrient uptake outer membrane protein [Adhaeribacter rhizoryzae]